MENIKKLKKVIFHYKNTDIQLSIILPNPDPILKTWGPKLVFVMTPCLKFWAQGVEFVYIFGVWYFTKSITQVTTQLATFQMCNFPTFQRLG